MLDDQLFDVVECKARTVRGNDHPIGGIQVVPL